jgi:predicted  nucleic acid-binding Zn-ribbon protein|tara:strand:- start:1581 stop:1862 length:282 start_codon:yes stop_codon:yes gene_type:complete
MSEEIKFTEEEMTKIKDFQNEYSNIQGEFGQSNIARLTLEDRLNDLMKKEEEIRKKFFDLQGKEKKFLEETTSKYGEGNLNPETGVFVPNKSS